MKKTGIMFVLAVLLLSVFPVTQASSTTNNVDQVVNEGVWKALNNTETAEVIITFKGEGKPTEEHLSLLESVKITTGISMNSLPIVGAVANKEQVEKLSKNDQVLSVYPNEKLTYFNADGNAISGVDEVRTDSEFTKQNAGFPISGKGVGVVVNDSGVDGTHKDHEFGKNLVQNVLGTTNLQGTGIIPISYTENVINTDTNSGHGTHVAGTVGGTGAMSGGKYEGVAPGADLIGYGSGGGLFILDGIGGFDYAITHQREYDIRVITNSWGSSGDFNPNHPINIASKKAYDRGIVVLFAAGNEGPAENTHNPYAKAPWVISVGAGVKDGTLADFSSRGTKDKGGTFTLDGEEWTWKDAPSIVAPGVDIISTRVVAPLSALSVTDDAELIEAAHLPYYTTMSGTSMATPHVAGIVALLLEVDSSLSPAEVKSIIEKTATNMPGYQTWEVGAGYVNAYAAVDMAINEKEYGRTLNSTRDYQASVSTESSTEDIEVTYTFSESDPHLFTVEEGLTNLSARIDAKGILGETGNPTNLVLTDPNGKEHSSGVSLLFPLSTERVVIVNDPIAGQWSLEVRGLRGDAVNPVGGAFPESVKGELTFTTITGFEGMSDIAGHEAESAIHMAVKNRLVDSYADGTFKPDAKINRGELANYLVMGAGIRQNLPDTSSFKDVSKADLPFAEAVVAPGAALKDLKNNSENIMFEEAPGRFKPQGSVTKAEIAYSLVQSLGLEKEAKEFEGNLTVEYQGERIPVTDQEKVPSHLKGHVQVALDLNILNPTFTISQGKYDLEPKVEALFTPNEEVTRGDFAVAFSRYYSAYFE